MKIYTRTGDKGTTGLFGGGRVSKHHPRIAAYGTVDETNTFVGAARSFLDMIPDVRPLEEMLHSVQDDLFVIGAELATPPESRAHIDGIAHDRITWLERSIDRLEDDLSPLKNFILPGGSPAGAMLHVARTVCRRAERLVVEMAGEESDPSNPLIYLNRLSDFLFVAARWVNLRAGIEETVWKGGS